MQRVARTRIGKIKPKSGGEIRVLHTPDVSKCVIDLKWGRVTLEYFGDDEPKKMQAMMANYILDAAKDKLINGEA